MRQRWAVMAGLGILLAGAGAWAQERATAEVLVLSERAEQPAPMILRGTPPARPPARVAAPAPGLQIVAGKRLWVIDQARGTLRSCINRDTSTVGLRLVECTSANLGRYARTFGAGYQP